MTSMTKEYGPDGDVLVGEREGDASRGAAVEVVASEPCSNASQFPFDCDARENPNLEELEEARRQKRGSSSKAVKPRCRGLFRCS